MDDDVVTLDVREDLRRGEEPLPKILATVEKLRPGQSLRLLATFEPIPLFAVMARKGFTHQARRLGPESWEVIFRPGGKVPEVERADAKKAQEADEEPWPSPAKSIDNRGLLPPEPMIRVLESLETLAPGEVLEVFNDREPMFLYPELEARGHRVRVAKLSEGGVRLEIRKGEG